MRAHVSSGVSGAVHSFHARAVVPAPNSPSSTIHHSQLPYWWQHGEPSWRSMLVAWCCSHGFSDSESSSVGHPCHRMNCAPDSQAQGHIPPYANPPVATCIRCPSSCATHPPLAPYPPVHMNACP